MIFQDRQRLQSEVAVRRSNGEKIVFTNGCFDLLHQGHLWLLDEASRMGYLIIGINGDDSVRRLKGSSRPFWPESHRAEILSRMGFHVILFEEDDPESLVEIVRPDILVKGDDYVGRRIAGEQYCGKLQIVDRLPNLSTSLLLGRMNASLA